MTRTQAIFVCRQVIFKKITCEHQISRVASRQKQVISDLFVFGLSTQEKDLRHVPFSCVDKSQI